MDAPKILQILSSIAVVVSAGVVAFVGIRGLRQWRAQLEGNDEY